MPTSPSSLDEKLHFDQTPNLKRWNESSEDSEKNPENRGENLETNVRTKSFYQQDQSETLSSKENGEPLQKEAPTLIVAQWPTLDISDMEANVSKRSQFRFVISLEKRSPADCLLHLPALQDQGHHHQCLRLCLMEPALEFHRSQRRHHKEPQRYKL